MSKPKVFFAGADNRGWALDEDLRLTKMAIQDVIDVTEDIAEADVIHSAWWEPFTLIPDNQLAGKRLIAHVPGEPYRYLKTPGHRHTLNKVSHWIVRSSQALRQYEKLALDATYIPYVVDTDIFYPLELDAPEHLEMIEKWQIPTDRYIIGNFHRDSEGADLHTPKLVKGPDLFAVMMRTLVERGYPIHVLLAGPRRHWMRQTLEAYNVPYTFVGQLAEEDDFEINVLPRHDLNILYSICDLYVVSSRSEGGPQSTMESGACKCKIISTRVGLAEDILDPVAIYDTVIEGIEIVQNDIDSHILDESITPQYSRVLNHHTRDVTKTMFIDLYKNWDSLPIYQPQDQKHSRTSWQKSLRKLVHRFRPDLSIGLWHTFFKPPYGGGNQFLLALRKAFKQESLNIIENRLSFLVDAYLLNSIHFDVDKFQKQHSIQNLKIVHRIDGPIFLIRGFDKEKDDLAFEINQELAHSTVLQSFWSYERILEMGYRPVKPVIVHNAVDADIFHKKGRRSFDPNEKIRLISSSWSGNPRKGGPMYKWLDQNLDWDRCEYTFVGRASEEFENIKLIDPVPSEDLADILRQHDIYITASQRDPCSNALIEALQCGLPALYFNDGGHPELVQYGGLPFEGEEDILLQLERLINHYELFKELIVTRSMTDVASVYLTLLKDAIHDNG